MNDRRLPKLRFKGFKDDWEQRKLGEIADKVTEKNSGLQYLETLTNSAEFGIISQRDFFDHDISKTTSLGGYYIVRSEDFVYNPRISVTAPVGPINRNKLGRTGVMSPLYTVFRPHDVDTTYLEHFFKSSCWHSFMNFNGDSGARSDRFSIKDNVFFEMPIPTPDIEEQGQIGECLTHLDHLITLHQRKLEKLKIVKKAMLENCFPKNGEKVPKFRFSGFTGDWEQRKFDKVFDGLQNNTLSRADLNYESGTVKNVHYGDVLIKFGDYIDASKIDLPYISDDTKADKFKSSFLQDGDIIIADTAEDDTVGKCTEIQGSEGLRLLSGLHTIACRPKEKYGPMFLGYYINSPAYHNQLKPLMQGIKVTSISKSALQNTYMTIPKSIDEQITIGKYFSNLDHLITLHQRKLEKLKIIKKSFLEKMFV